jgi:hypothetical protein
VIAPASYTGSTLPNAVRVSLGDLGSGDSVVITFSASTTGPVTRVSDNAFNNNNGNFNFCYGPNGNYYLFTDGPAISAVQDGKLEWSGTGCASGNFSMCTGNAQASMFNSVTQVAEPGANAPLFLARFRNYTYVDSTLISSGAVGCQTYYGSDTVKILMTAAVTDIPFYTDKSKLCIKVYTNGGTRWDGNLSKVYARLSSWSNTNWLASSVADNTLIDSTISVYFKRSNCPVAGTFASDPFNSYRGGAFQFNIQLLNTCPGPAQKQMYVTRIYDIDTTNAEPPIESGPAPGNFKLSWISACPQLCLDGIQVLDYSHARTTFGAPDNNNDGNADASGTLNMSVVKTKLITWGDTLQLKYKLLVTTTQPGGLAYLYINSAINNSNLALNNSADNIACNAMLKKCLPQVKLIRPGTGTFNGNGTALPVDTANSSLLNLSLQGAGAINLPGITTYQNGDTLEITQNLVYWKPHETFNGLYSWNFTHSPYTSTVANPAPAQRFRCDSVSCAGFQTIDFTLASASSQLTGGACQDSIVLRTSLYAQTMAASCGATYFPGEARSIVTPTVFKMVIPVASNWQVQRIYAYWGKKINGTGNCTNTISNQLLPASLYSFSAGTLTIDLVQLGAFYGQDITVNQMRSIFTFDIGLRYNAPTSQQGCGKDHANPATNFNISGNFKATCPLDTTSLLNRPYSTVSFPGGNPANTVNPGWPGANTNNVSTISAVSVTTSAIVLPTNYFKGVTSGNDFLAIPDRPGIIVDSVKDNVTGLKLVTTPGSGIYQLGYLPTNTTRALSVHTHVQSCQNDTLFMYADRTPCTGLPASWSAYACKAAAGMAFVRYNTFSGELQMQDTLYSTQKDLCTADTVQFKVVNSQTQHARSVKISFVLPAGMSLMPGQTQLKKANGSFVTVADPVLNAGTYTWTMPAGDSLPEISTAPNNTMYLRCGIMTACGYISGSQITSSIAGNVACGPITSLFNSNPPALNINGAPSLSYFSNVQATVQPVTGCGASSAYDYRIAMHISGGATLTSDSVKVTLPAAYNYVAYNPAAPGSVHAPSGAPVSVVLGNGTRQLTWKTPAGVPAGDSIIFTFRYTEVSAADNKCASSPARNSFVSTSINATAFCATTGTNCSLGIGNGGDTVSMQSLKPAISTTTSTVVYGNASLATNPGAQSYLHITGALQNTGTAAVPPGTNIIMEPFMDLDNSGTITSGDYAFDPLVYSGGLAVNGNHPYTYADSLNPSACPACAGKNVLLRFSNNPAQPLASSQCYCDSVLVMPAVANTVLDLKLGDFNGRVHDCSKALLRWTTLNESGAGLHFEIEVSTNGKDFSSVGNVPASGTENGSSYEQIVGLPANKAYYRLVLWADGKKTYSNLVTVQSDCGDQNKITVYPNPFTNKIRVLGAGKGSEISLMDAVGRKLASQRANGSGTDVLNLDSFASGAYMLLITDGHSEPLRIKLVKD